MIDLEEIALEEVENEVEEAGEEEEAEVEEEAETERAAIIEEMPMVKARRRRFTLIKIPEKHHPTNNNANNSSSNKNKVTNLINSGHYTKT